MLLRPKNSLQTVQTEIMIFDKYYCRQRQFIYDKVLNCQKLQLSLLKKLLSYGTIHNHDP